MLRPQGIFVTGTDTDIGKTVVSTLLTLGLGGSYWKPIQSGFSKIGNEEQSDSSFVQSFLEDRSVIPESYKLSRPLSPHLAAKLDGTQIDLEQIYLPAKDIQGPLIVEGAGGVLVPINDHLMIIDLIKKFNFPTLVVARSSLGTINHTLLTLASLRSRGISILGVAMVGEKNTENKKAIEKFGKTPVLFEIAKIKNFSRKSFEHIYQTSDFFKLHKKDAVWN